ncbi:sigma E protease regulator RseP [Psychrosphaera sp.]|nr:sigma E protease regulator RseP [Psychrosphaera sp.]
MDILINVVSFLVALGILVFVHEYGHYWVARKNGVEVLRFAIGFGKPIYSWVGKNGTEYVIGLIPLGGYVRMLDGRVDDVPAHKKSVSFDQKHVLRRISIVAAGPLANFIFAAVLIFIMLLIGVPAVKPVIGDIKENSAAAEAGLLKNDLVIKIDQDSVNDWSSVQYKLIDQIGNPSIPMSVIRNDKELSISVKTDDWKVEEGELFSSLGFTPFSPEPSLTLNYIDEAGPAYAAGFLVGDVLVSFNKSELKSWSQAVEVITNSADKVIEVKVLRKGNLQTLTVTPLNRPTLEGFSSGYLGVAPKYEEWPKDYVFTNQYAILPAVSQSFVKTWDLIKLTFNMIGKFVTGAIGLENLSGPIAIAQGAGISAQSGFVYFISFMALISVNLGVVNLLPLPVLDGGHLMYFIIELIRGKPVSERVQEMGFRFGAIALFMIMGIALFNDFGRL